METIVKFEYDLNNCILTAFVIKGDLTYKAAKPCGLNEIELRKADLLNKLKNLEII